MESRASSTPTTPSRQRAVDPSVIISAVFFDGYADRDADEAVQLWNLSPEAIDLGGWTISDGEGSASFPASPPFRIGAGQYLWLGADERAFTASFGRRPDGVWSAGRLTARAMPSVYGGPKLANSGDDLELSDAQGKTVDALVYGRGPAPADWLGPPLWPFHTAQVGAAHQVLFRKLDPRSGRPFTTGSSVAVGQWSSDPADPRFGRRFRRPGWSQEARSRPALLAGPATVELALAPDGFFAFLSRHLAAAERSIVGELYTFENPDLALLVANRARAGLAVSLLLDGAPVGGFEPNQRWSTAVLAEAGAKVSFLDDGDPVDERFRSLHAKILVLDGREVIVATENPNLGSTPTDDLADGTSGRRGMALAITSPDAVRWAEGLLAEDLDASRFGDVRPYQARDPVRGAMPAGFEPLRVGGGAGYVSQFAAPVTATGPMTFVFQTAPENSLDQELGLIGLVNRAGAGDRVSVMQMDEPQWWGSGPTEGPVAENPRWAAYVAAARRGATVRVLLDSYFDDASGWNANFDAAKAYNALALGEGLDLEVRTGNPTGQGIHAKLVLVALEGPNRFGAGPPEHWTHLGSQNGSEVANKLNREVAVNLESEPIWRHLDTVFAADWLASPPHRLFLPGPAAASSP